jgi:dTDP-4-dehydrorhamnose 3,5-epimerase
VRVPFSFSRTALEGLIVIDAQRFDDERGFFMETYKASEFSANGISAIFVQDNHSKSCRGVLRGLHFQSPPHAQGKLVRVIAGRVWDVAVDLRPGSRTYAQWYGVELSSETQRMLFLPEGFAHGFVTLSETAEFVYMCTAEYSIGCDGGLRWDDPDLGIAWPIRDVTVSKKDALLPFLREWESQHR